MISDAELIQFINDNKQLLMDALDSYYFSVHNDLRIITTQRGKTILSTEVDKIQNIVQVLKQLDKASANEVVDQIK